MLAGRCGDGVSVEVRDSGAGMDAETLARIFQPFFTTKAKGMGLGLSISRTIVEAHGGTLSAHSAPGEGSTFRIELPLRPSRRHRLTASADAGTVFVIDDDPSVRRALERQLRTAGFRVETFASAQDYVARAPQAGIACIVTDVRMPGMSGLDLQDSLAQAGRALPMVFITGHGDIPTTVRAMKGGAVNFLPKPFAEREILAAVAEALERSRAIERERRETGSLRARYEALTAREREVLALVVAGLLNKVIADRLGIAGDHDQGPPRPGDGEDGGGVARRPGADERAPRPRARRGPGAALTPRPASGSTTKVAFPDAARRRTLAPCSRRTSPTRTRENRFPRQRAKRAAVLPRRGGRDGPRRDTGAGARRAAALRRGRRGRGVAYGRLLGMTLLALVIACWPRRGLRPRYLAWLGVAHRPMGILLGRPCGARARDAAPRHPNA